MEIKSLIKWLAKTEEFIDRKTINDEDPIDVILPLINTNILFEKNLKSFYKEIPINRLIVGDAGVTDDSINIVKKFPRVEVIDQKKYISLGYCIAELISFVETEWFIYLHADVFLPENWYDIMKKYQNKYDWYECDRRMMVFIEYDPGIKNTNRAYSGSQIGRKKAFENLIPKIDDDYLQRNEDIIFQELVLKEGLNYGRVLDTFHYHQVMNKKGEKEPKIKKVSIERLPDKQWEKKMYSMQAKGIIKYLQPKPYLIKSVNTSLKILKGHNSLNITDFMLWVKATNKNWLKYIKINEPIYIVIYKKLILKIKSILRLAIQK